MKTFLGHIVAACAFVVPFGSAVAQITISQGDVNRIFAAGDVVLNSVETLSKWG